MAWKCFMLSGAPYLDAEYTQLEGGGRTKHMNYPLPDGRLVHFNDLPIGAMWMEPADRTRRGIDSLAVLLPGRVIWRIDDFGTNDHLWNRQGEPPNVTVKPSINFVGIYHGWVQNGVVTDDCEGRKFDERGKRLS